MIDLLIDTEELADLICQSEEAKSFLVYRSQLSEDAEARDIINRFQKVKENYEEAQRFGRFHPNYHEAKREAQSFQKEMFKQPRIQNYLEAEKKVDKLLYEVSCVLAHSVSKEVMVPNDHWNRGNRGCKCKE